MWKRNRNMHARLLLSQLRAGQLSHPFIALPGPGPVPILGRWALAPYCTLSKGSPRWQTRPCTYCSLYPSQDLLASESCVCNAH